MAASTIRLHRGDLPAGLDLGHSIAVDSETLGLNPHRDRLCLVQLSAGDGTAHLVQFEAGRYEDALKWWRRALEVNPNMIGVEINIKEAERLLEQKRRKAI